MTESPPDSPPPLRWATWRAVWTLILAVLAARVLFQWLSPLELVADEAQYWDWSRRLDLSYYSKGPGIAWLIAGARWLLGEAEWAIRFPAALAAAVATWALAKLASECADGDPRVAFYAAAAFTLFPGYQISSLVMTIDGPHVLGWILAAWAARRVFAAQRAGRGSLAAWLALGLSLGVGFLFKYTILLLVPGLVLYVLWDRRQLRWTRRDVLGLLAAVGVLLLALGPVVFWNARHDWPTVRHLLGRVHLPGGDMPPIPLTAPSTQGVPWIVHMLGSQLAILGPAAVLLFLSLRHALRPAPASDGSTLTPAASHRRSDQRLMIALGAPILVFYTLVALVGKVQANWPLPGYATLFVLFAQFAPGEIIRFRQLVMQWRRLPTPRPRRGYLRKRPETPFQFAWHVWIGWGIATSIAAVLALPLATLASPRWPSVLRRIQGSRDRAAAVEHAAQIVRQRTGAEPLVITHHYGLTGLMAYYLPGHPVVYCGAPARGDRQSSYDYFADTRLDNPALRGRPVVLVGPDPQRWRDAFLWQSDQPFESAGPDIYIGVGYDGPARPAQAAPSSPSPQTSLASQPAQPSQSLQPLQTSPPLPPSQMAPTVSAEPRQGSAHAR